MASNPNTPSKPSPEHKPRMRITADTRPVTPDTPEEKNTLTIGRTVWLGTRSYAITAFTRSNNVDHVTMVSLDNTKFEVSLPRRLLEEENY